MFEEQEEKVVELKETTKAKRKPFAVWTVKGEDYKLKLTTDAICQLESKLNGNLLSVIETLPPLNVMCGIIQAAMQKYHHGIKFNTVKELVDHYIDEDGSQLELFTDVIVPIFQVSGFFSVELGEAMEENLETAKANI